MNVNGIEDAAVKTKARERAALRGGAGGGKRARAHKREQHSLDRDARFEVIYFSEDGQRRCRIRNWSFHQTEHFKKKKKKSTGHF